MDRIGFAVVGAGVIGQVHAKNVSMLESCKLVAVADQVRKRAELVGQKFGAKAYTSIDEVVKDPEVEAVVIATPSYLHAPQTLYALQYGKHVLVEKPMATTLRGARLISESAKNAGLRLGVVFQERYLETVRQLKELVSDGGLGKVYLIEAELKWWRGESDYYRSDEIARSWRGYWETEGGGVLMNQAIHTLDLVLWLGGEVEEVSGYISNASHPSVEVEDVATAAIRFRSGALGTISATVNIRPTNRQYRKIRVLGTNGFAEIHDLSLRISTEEGEVQVDGSGVVFGDLHRALLADFADCIRGEREFPVNGDEGIKSLELVKAIYLSSERGVKVSLPLRWGDGLL
ncbi:Glucose--fructose oxidoreductase [Candidatus Calditenuaceae archaeon HR02]|nr:Glucose--fructose oxidoreductase [Candidatus Calditenuaceae archaeon HR02]